MLKAKVKTTFKRSVLKKRFSKIQESPLKKAGLKIRTIARRSIRRASGKTKKTRQPSPAGTPPRSRSKGDPLKLIFSVPNKATGSVVVGPIGFGSKDNRAVPGIHEHGKAVTTRVRESKKVPRSKDSTRKQRKAYRSKVLSGEVVSTKTVRFLRKRIKYRKRPFMRPAFEKIKPQIPKMFAGTL
tara:strand:+ start:2953 stop:3504 length:552 start_codon:yes stop_codon:yes gene_type:complete